MTPQETLVAYARQIAIYRGYPDLMRGLQPVSRLVGKLAHEEEELKEAQATKSRLHVYHEAADVLYYAASLEEQALDSQYADCRTWLSNRGINPALAERAALAKYGWRASAAGNKDEAYELRLIASVLYRLVICDADGTLTTPASGAAFRKSASDWQWLPGRRDALIALRKAGCFVAVATNQGGVAFGYLSQADILRELSAMMKQAALPMGGLYICYNHPQASIPEYRLEDHRRKPGPGMLQDAMRDFGIVEPIETLMVGDRPEDMAAANAAGCDFVWANQFFGDVQA